MDEENFDLEELKKAVLDEMHKTYTIKQALELKEKEEQEFKESFDVLWQSYHSVESFRKEAIKNLKIVKYRTILSNLILLMIRNDFREDAKNLYDIFDKAIKEIKDEKELLNQIYIALEKLQAHYVSSCNYELSVLLSYIYDKNEAIYNQVQDDLISHSVRMNGISTQNPDRYKKQKEDLDVQINDYVLKLGLNK